VLSRFALARESTITIEHNPDFRFPASQPTFRLDHFVDGPIKKAGRVSLFQADSDYNDYEVFQREAKIMALKHTVVGILAAGCIIAASMLLTTAANAQADPKVTRAMALLKADTGALGAPKVEGTEAVAGKTAPALFFGTTKMNNYFTVVDNVVKSVGGTATLFVKSGDEYVRVATNVKKDDGSRAIGTILDPKGKAIVEINAGKAFYGEVDILGKPFVTGYDPIKDGSGAVIGIYYVGYGK
jgi:hypothetical protein